MVFLVRFHNGGNLNWRKLKKQDFFWRESALAGFLRRNLDGWEFESAGKWKQKNHSVRFLKLYLFKSFQSGNFH